MLKLKEKIKELSWGKKEQLIGIVICSGLIVIGCLSLFLLRTMEERAVTVDLYQLRMGVRYDFKAKNRFYRQDGETILESGTLKQVMADSLPVYYKDRDRMMLVDTMSYIDPATRKSNKIDYYTNLTLKDNGKIDVQRGFLPKEVNGGFLFNGSDTYVFLEDMTLMVLDKEIELPAFSSLVVQYRNSIEIMNYKTKEGEIIHTSTSDVKVKCEEYTIDLAFDKISYSDGFSHLLIGKPDLLPSFH